RSAAHESGVDPSQLAGHGADGRVTLDDVRAAESRDEIVPFNNIRRRTAVALLASKQTAAHACTVSVADYRAIETVRRAAGMTALPFVARAAIDALREFPVLNATVDTDDTLTLH